MRRERGEGHYLHQTSANYMSEKEKKIMQEVNVTKNRDQ